ncbi:MAG: FG-GAP repeat protein [Nitrosotalea sp.]
MSKIIVSISVLFLVSFLILNQIPVYGDIVGSLPTVNGYNSQIIVHNQTLGYLISGGNVTSASFNSVLPALDVSIAGSSGGSVTFNIPRNLIDSKDRFTNDVPFVVTINGKEIPQPSEQQSDYSRTLTLEFNPGISFIEIIGTGVAHLQMSSSPSIIKITDPNPYPKDLFGISISASNGNIIIGSPNAISKNSTRGGVVYLFDTNGTQLLSIPDPDSNDADQFGFAVTSLDNVIIVGSPNALSSNVQCGKVFMFDVHGKLLKTITDPDPHSGDQFGYSLATYSGNILIGSPSHVNDKVQSGSVYIFNGTTGKQLVNISNPDKENKDLFGFSMVPIGNQIAIGTPDDNYGALQAGSVFVFDTKSGNLMLTLRNPSPDNRTEPNQGSDQFGFSLASTNNSLVVGERGGDIKSVVNGQEEYMEDQSGNVRIYDITTGKISLTIDDPHPVQNNDFGVSVSASNNKILIGMNHDDTSGYDSGSVFLYDISGMMLREIQNPNPTPVDAETMGNYFGSSVMFLNNDMVVGAPGDNSGATNAGAVYVIGNQTIEKIMSPLQQFRSGIAAKDVKCLDGSLLTFKAEDDSPACVKPETMGKLIERGWGFILSKLPTSPGLTLH